jgi:hypothetical protein
MLQLAIRRPQVWPKQHAATVVVALSHVDFAEINGSISTGAIKERNIHDGLKHFVRHAFDPLTLLNGAEVVGSISPLAKILQPWPAAINSTLIFEILDGTLGQDEYLILDGVLQALPEEMCRKIAILVSNQLGPNPRTNKMALYLGRRYGGDGAWAERRRAWEMELPGWM